MVYLPLVIKAMTKRVDLREAESESGRVEADG